MLKFEKYQEFRIKGNSKYFSGKYGNPNPIIEIEDLCSKILGQSWMFAQGNPAALQYAMRSAMDGLPTDDNVYYGKINGLGELVHESELEDLVK